VILHRVIGKNVIIAAAKSFREEFTF